MSSGNTPEPKVVVVFGSRTIEDYFVVCDSIMESGWTISELVTGCAPRGPDELGQWWAKLNKLPIARFPAQWGKFGKKAGPVRNLEMARYVQSKGGAAIGVWDGVIKYPSGKNSGTYDMVKTCRRLEVPTFVYRVDVPGVSPKCQKLARKVERLSTTA